MLPFEETFSRRIKSLSRNDDSSMGKSENAFYPSIQTSETPPIREKAWSAFSRKFFRRKLCFWITLGVFSADAKFFSVH